MVIQTTRFGPVDVDDGKILTFPEGLLGFPRHCRYALLQTGSDPAFFWMQSVEDPDLAFVVCDPRLFVPDYQVALRADEAEALGLRTVDDGQVLVIVNRVNGDLTGNLLGPLVVSTQSRQARQVVLADKRYTTRHRLVAAETAQALAKTA